MNEVRTFTKIIAPIGLILGPSGILFLIYASLTAHDSLPIIDYIVWISYFLLIFLLSLWFCKKHLGWFSKKTK